VATFLFVWTFINLYIIQKEKNLNEIKRVMFMVFKPLYYKEKEIV